MPPRWPRWLNRAWAALHGYFWIACPRCGRPFGGHETGGDDVPTARRGVSHSACWRCVVPVEQLMAEQRAAWGYVVVDAGRWLAAGRPE